MTLASEFGGRSVVVTGGTGALGRAVVGELLERGASVHVPWIDEREVTGSLYAGRATLAKLDLGDEGSVRTYYGAIDDLWGSIHAAGGFAMAPVADTSAAEFTRLFQLNATTCFVCCREAVRVLRRGSGGASAPRGGRIVNVAARPAVVPTSGMIAYAASKAAVASLTQHLAEEVKSDGILVNAVLPSIMDTPANRAAMPKADHGAWPKVEEVAKAIVWLASPENALTSGALVPVYGRA